MWKANIRARVLICDIIKNTAAVQKTMKLPTFLSRFRRKPNTLVGIDVGTSSIKIVELAKVWQTGREGEIIQLNTYGELKIPGVTDGPASSMQRSALQMLDSDVAQMIHEIMQEANVNSGAVSLSIPVSSSFFTVLELPPMGVKELKEAIPFQARQLVPVPISEVVLDWEIVGREKGGETGKAKPQKEKLLVVVVAVPRDVIDKYVRIAELAKLELRGLEVETFSLVRSVVREDRTPLLLVDIGAKATNLSVIDEGTIRMSHNLDTSGAEITKAIARGVGIGIDRAEAFKREQGLVGQGAETAVAQPIRPLLDIIFAEADKLATVYLRKHQRTPQKILLVGGTANLPGLLHYAQERLGKETAIGAPFSDIHYPPLLEPVIKEIGPEFSVAVGLALRELQ